MINEYLFSSDQYQENVKEYRPDGIIIYNSSIDNTSFWIIAYSLPGSNEDSANKLSDVHSFIMQYTPIVLSCESSEYYNRMLFPLINKLERKLRKLLYLVASISDNEKAKESIKQLEERDFGEIFDLLFIDQNFILDVKKRINADGKSDFNGKGKYSKSEVQEYLNSLQENTLWDNILGKENVPTLRIRFRDVQTYRNDVMHAHNIGKEVFERSRYLFNEIIGELNCSISNLTESVKNELDETRPDVNLAISSTMATMDLSAISEALNIQFEPNTSLEISSHFSKAWQELQLIRSNPAFIDTIKKFQGMQSTIAQTVNRLDPIINNPAIVQTIKELQSIRENSALVEALHKIYTVQTSPAIESIRRQIIDVNNLMKPYKDLQDSIRSLTDYLPHAMDLTKIIKDLKNDSGK